MNNLIIHYLFTFEINSHKSNALLMRKKCVFINVIIVLKTKCDYIECFLYDVFKNVITCDNSEM
jgi:hypothetical protein